MKKLKVGDRVRLLGPSVAHGYGGPAVERVQKGSVIEVDDSLSSKKSYGGPLYWVQTDESKRVHGFIYKNLRRLVKNRPPQAGDKVSFTGHDSNGMHNYGAWYTLKSAPDSSGFVTALFYKQASPIVIHISGCKKGWKKK